MLLYFFNLKKNKKEFIYIHHSYKNVIIKILKKERNSKINEEYEQLGMFLKLTSQEIRGNAHEILQF